MTIKGIEIEFVVTCGHSMYVEEPYELRTFDDLDKALEFCRNEAESYSYYVDEMYNQYDDTYSIGAVTEDKYTIMDFVISIRRK